MDTLYRILNRLAAAWIAVAGLVAICVWVGDLLSTPTAVAFEVTCPTGHSYTVNGPSADDPAVALDQVAGSADCVGAMADVYASMRNAEKAGDTAAVQKLASYLGAHGGAPKITKVRPALNLASYVPAIGLGAAIVFGPAFLLVVLAWVVRPPGAAGFWREVFPIRPLR